MDLGQALGGAEGAEDLLGLGRRQLQVAGHQIGQPPRVVEVGGDHLHLGRHVLAQPDHPVETLLDAAHQRLGLEAGFERRVVDRLDARLQEGPRWRL